MKATKNTPIINPRTGTTSFGVIPEMATRQYYFPEGSIVLRHGVHTGPNRGWGLNHIWHEHSAELISLGYLTSDRVANYVSDIIQVGAGIYCEFFRMGSERLTVLKSSLGMAILEHRKDGHNEDFYSVITVFNRKVAHGQLIGRIK